MSAWLSFDTWTETFDEIAAAAKVVIGYVRDEITGDYAN